MAPNLATSDPPATLVDVDALRRALLRRGLSQAEFAAAAGVSEVTVSRLMHGARPRRATLARLAECLETVPVLPGAWNELLEGG